MSKQKNTVVNMQNQAYPNPAFDMPPAYPGYAQNMPLPDPGYAQNVPPPHLGYAQNVPPSHPGYAQNMPHLASSSKNAPAVDLPQVQVLGSESVRTVCQNCFKEISTRVDSSISSTGWAWVIICCFCGSWIASCLVNCLPGFRKFTHSCPSCNVIIGEVEPEHSGGHKAIIAISVFLILALIFAIIFLR